MVAHRHTQYHFQSPLSGALRDVQDREYLQGQRLKESTAGGLDYRRKHP